MLCHPATPLCFLSFLLGKGMSFQKKKTGVSPWGRITKQGCYTEDDVSFARNYGQTRPKFYSLCSENRCLDIVTKRAAIKASPSVVSLVSYSDDKEIFQGSGTIIENDGVILTSAYFVRSPTGQNIVADNIKVIVYLFDGKSYEARVIVHDFHYNFAIAKIESTVPLPTASIVSVDDCLSLDPSELRNHADQGFAIRRHSSTFTLSPGHDVIALGRHFSKPYDIMVAPGEFSIYRYDCKYDCKELFMTTCKITTTGVGGPLINGTGEVIGVIFHDRWCTPFIPINVAVKWWNHYKQNGVLCHPYFGMDLTNLYAVRVRIMEKVIHKLPNNFTGVMVDEVVRGSPADFAAMRPNDLIIQCCGKVVRSFLELFEMIWDKTGNSVDLVVIRANEDVPLHISVPVLETSQDKLYSWPLCRDFIG